MKTKTDRKVNKIAKRVNRMLKKDVFGDRFWVRQVKKLKGKSGLQYYLYELRDRLEPERNHLFTCGWLWGDSFFLSADFFEQANDFIVRSDFWAKYWNDESRYNEKLDFYKNMEYNKWRS